jgi:hypothetical protein
MVQDYDICMKEVKEIDIDMDWTDPELLARGKTAFKRAVAAKKAVDVAKEKAAKGPAGCICPD